MNTSLPIHCLALLLLGNIWGAVSAEQPVSFSRDVLPILADRCFHCHGPNVEDGNADSDLRLDLREQAVADRGGYAAIVPNQPDASELVARITAEDDGLRMPPPDSHRKSLSPAEIETLRKWIAEGAVWGRHWSFQPIRRPTLPDVLSHPVDAFVRKRQAAQGLAMSPRAAPHTLLRRLSFDITGLPPTQQELQDFLKGVQETGLRLATEAVVDRLLESPHYGERMAMWWLDLSRYADTDGYQGDATRTNWPWRDWVVSAFSGNMPFDQFTVEQFAGDLLENATDEQILATCFHRNHMTNGEGGRHPEESRIDYVIDRVNTMGTVWMGLTLGCAQCHSHKFDPISQRDYYSLFAFFNNIAEDGRAGSGAKPFLKYQSDRVARAVQEMQLTVDERKRQASTARDNATGEFELRLPAMVETANADFQAWHPLRTTELYSAEGTTLHQAADGIIRATGSFPFQDDYVLVANSPLRRVTGIRLEVFPHESHTEGKLTRGSSGEFILTDVKLQLQRKDSLQLDDIEFGGAVADVEKDAQGRAYGKVSGTLDDDPRNGWTTQGHDPRKKHVAVFALATPLQIATGDQLRFVMLHRSTYGYANIGRYRVSVTDQPGVAVRSLDAMPMEKLSAAGLHGPAEVPPKLKAELLDQFLNDHQGFQRVRTRLQRAERQLKELEKAAKPLSVMVLKEQKKVRDSHVLVRGVWDKQGDSVTRDVPSAVASWPSAAPKTRLELARWLVSGQNPLTARVIVNHVWQLLLGNGLVRTPEDFGLQGDQPTHPALLDWLAVELVESGWNLQHIIRLIVTSETYQQSSNVTPALLTSDPENRWLARAPRFRLPSWMLRDAALRSSGLFNPAVGGPPVFPYQPAGVWAEIFMGRFRYEPSEGAAQYRRTLYAFWRRSSAPAFLFDNAMRQVCETRVYRTNTPLHALNLLNDETRRDASRALALAATAQSNAVADRLEFLFQRVLSRRPNETELVVLRREYDRALAHYQLMPEDARAYVTGNSLESFDDAYPELGALMVVCSMIFNTDEAITHE